MDPTDTPRATTKLPLASHSGKKRKITRDTAIKTSEEVVSDPNSVGSSAAKRTKLFHGSRNGSEGMSKKYLRLPTLQGNEDMLLQNEECTEVGVEYSTAKNFAQPQKAGNSRKKKIPSSTAGSNMGDTTARAVKKNASKKTYALHNTTEMFSPAGEGDEDVIMGDTLGALSTFVTPGPISLAAFAAGVKTMGTMNITQPMMPTSIAAANTNSIQRANSAVDFKPLAPIAASRSISNVFTTPPPNYVSPWPFRFPQATTSYAVDIACPINWSCFSKLEDKHIKAYELRAPWNPHPASWKHVAEEYQKLTGQEKLDSEEGTRKRFKKANEAIFEATGIYFLYSGLGLKKYGVPNDSEMPHKMREAGLTSGPAPKLNKGSRTTTISGKDLVYESNTSTLIVQPPGESGPFVRLISKKIVETLRITSDKVIPFSAETFDRWHSCVCFGSRHSLPKRLYKLKQLWEGYAYVDEGMPRITFNKLLDTYCLSQFMGTTAVSDMILDEIQKVLKDEKVLFTKYQTGAICEKDCNDVIRFLDLQPADIEELWQKTKTNDPVRSLIVDLLTHKLAAHEQSDRTSVKTLRSGRQARNLFVSFARIYREAAIEDFVNVTNPALFCALYHTHNADEPCYRKSPLASLSKKMIDDTIDFPNTHLLEIKGIANCKVINKTGSSINLHVLQDQTPHWDWERICSINSWILIPPKGPQIRQPRPVYFELGTKDIDGRYPSHPGFNNPAWAPARTGESYNKGERGSAKR